MKSLKTSFLILAAVAGVTACSGLHTTHIHTFSEKWSMNSSCHYHKCTGCQAITDENEHDFGEYKSDDNAVLGIDGTKTRTCNTCSYEDTVSDVKSNYASGAVINNTEIILSCDTENTVIRYTTDGTEPTKSSSIYDADSHILINSATTVKAFAYAPEMNCSPILTFKYVTYSTYTVNLDSFDASKKIPVIKAVREVTGLGLGEAKALVERAPAVVKTGVSYDDATVIQEKITYAGGTVSLTGCEISDDDEKFLADETAAVSAE